MSETLKSYRDFFHVERDDLNVAATDERAGNAHAEATRLV